VPDSPTQSAAVELCCPECDYNLTVAASERCPSCGWLIDAAELVSSSRPRFGAQRIGIIVAAAALSGGSFLVIMFLGVFGKKLNLLDGVVLFAILLAAGGHAALACAAAGSGRVWPMRLQELRAVLTMAGCVSILAALIGATQALDFEPTPRVVKGVKVNGALEFGLAMLLFTFPGWSLLLLRFISFRPAPSSAPTSGGRGPRPTSGARVGAPFIVEFASVYRRDEVTQRPSSAVRPRSPALEAAVARIWESELALAQDADRELYNGELGRLIRADAVAESLCLELGCTSYREFLGTNLLNATAVWKEGVEYFADPLGVSVVVVTLDNWLALGRRGRRVAFHAGWLHPFGGMLEATDRGPDGTYDVFGCAARELMEEAGVRAHESGDRVILGLVRDRAIHQPELIFRARIKLKRSELDAVFDPRFSGGEHSGMEYVADTPDDLIEAIEKIESVTAVAQASLLLHGRDRWGEGWYASACQRLYEA